MAISCLSVVDAYLNHLKGEFAVESRDGDCIIVVPFYRPDGAAIEIAVRENQAGGLRLTDECSTIDYLFINGLDIGRSEDLTQAATRIANRHGVSLEHSELVVDATPESMAEALDKLISSITAVTYLIYRRVHRVSTTFTEEVELYLVENRTQFKARYALRGETIEHVVPIYINSRINFAITPLSVSMLSSARHKVKELGYMSVDVRAVREEVRFGAVLDDRKPSQRDIWMDPDIQSILSKRMDRIIFWESRQELLRLSEPR